MNRYKLTIEYDGTGFHGWQRQSDEFPSVQQHIEEAIYKIIQQKVILQVAGRTDAGVHALAQVAHFDSDIERDHYRLMQGINHHLGEYPIVVNKVEIMDDEFHARFGAVRRYYLYRIIQRRTRLVIEDSRAWQVNIPLDIEKMQQAAEHFKGTHDFTSFRASECQGKSPVKTLDNLDIKEQKTIFGEEIHITTDAKSFLHHQVRNIVGTLILVGKGKWQPEDIITALEAKDRKAGGPTAPAHGLYFMGVDY